MASSTDEDNLCSICMEQCKQPQKLLCEHLFCTKCLSEYRQKVCESGKQTFPCPLCRTETDWSDMSEHKLDIVGSGATGGATGGMSTRKILRIASSVESKSCDICKVNKKSKTAVVRCRVCSESMCTECETYHKAMKATRNHPLVDIDSYPNEGSYDLRHCPVHNEESFDSFCEVHQQLCCKTCVEDHRQCETVTKLKVTSESVEVFNGLQSLIGDLRLYEADIDQLTTDRKQSLQSLEKEKKSLRDEIEHFKKKVLAKITLELSRNLPLVEMPLQKDINQLIEDVDWCSTMMRELGNAIAFLENIFQNGSREDMFVSYYLMKGEVEEIRQSIINRHTEMKTTDVKFELNNLCQRFLNLSEPLLNGNLARHKTEFNLSTYLKPISDRSLEPFSVLNVKASGESNDCDITSVEFLPQNRILVFDKGNKAIKLFKESGIMESRLCSESYAPEIFTKVNASTFFLTSSTETEVDRRHMSTSKGSIRTYQVGSDITKQGLISIPSTHQATVLCNDMYVSTCPKSLNVLDKQGSVQQTITTNKLGDDMFGNCRFIAYSQPQGRVYVSDTEKNTVSAFDLVETRLHNEPSFVYRHEELRCPAGIAVSRRGYAFLCGSNSNNIHLISDKGNLLKIFPMPKPYAIALAEEGMKFAISNLEDLKKNRLYIFRYV